jgi:hypothetical protein
MADIRERLAAAIKHHLYNEAGRDQHALEVADVLLSLPGIAIIEPASDGTVWFDHGWVGFDESEINPSDPDQLRRFAATLLALANAAERAVTDG